MELGEDLAFWSRILQRLPRLGQEKMTELQKERQAQLGDVSGDIEKRDALSKEIQAPLRRLSVWRRR